MRYVRPIEVKFINPKAKKVWFYIWKGRTYCVDRVLLHVSVNSERGTKGKEGKLDEIDETRRGGKMYVNGNVHNEISKTWCKKAPMPPLVQAHFSDILTVTCGLLTADEYTRDYGLYSYNNIDYNTMTIIIVQIGLKCDE